MKNRKIGLFVSADGFRSGINGLWREHLSVNKFLCFIKRIIRCGSDF